MRGMGPPQDWALPIKAQGPEQSSQVECPPLAPQTFIGVPNQNQWDQQPPAPSPQPPQEEKKEKVGWACVECTFINKPWLLWCERCGTTKPDFVIPEDCPLDDDELISRNLHEQEEEKLFLQVCVCVCVPSLVCVVCEFP